MPQQPTAAIYNYWLLVDLTPQRGEVFHGIAWRQILDEAAVSRAPSIRAFQDKAQLLLRLSGQPEEQVAWNVPESGIQAGEDGGGQVAKFFAEVIAIPGKFRQSCLLSRNYLLRSITDESILLDLGRICLRGCLQNACRRKEIRLNLLPT